MTRNKKRASLGLALAALLAAVIPTGCADENARSSATNHLAATYARAWFDLLVTIVRDNALAPPPASRIYAYAAVTYFESVVPGSPSQVSLGNQLNGLGTLPEIEAGRGYDWPTVASAALAEVLPGLMPTAKPESLSAIAVLAAEQQAARATRFPSAVIERSKSHGQALAAAILSWAASDGIGTWPSCAYTPPQGAGLWQPTPAAFRPPLLPCWGQMRPFALERSSFCDVGGPLPYSTATSSPFHQSTREVYDIVASEDPEHQAIARFWSDDPGVTGTPPGHWISIVGQLSEQQSMSLGTAAEAYTRVGIAAADAFISCWRTKYQYNYLRPITAIRDQIDASWTSLLPTPPFPEYTSGHSVQSGAAAEVLTDLLGERSFNDNSHANRGLPARDFSSFRAAAMEAALSRIYGGIHFREACIVGLSQGECVGHEVATRIRWSRH